MDPNLTPTPNFDLPPVQLPEVSPATPPKAAELPPAQMNEQRNMEMPAMAPVAPPPGADPMVPAALGVASVPSVVPLPPSAVPGTASPTVDEIEAADSDLIEKAWVQKAKNIVAQTREDPFKQNNEITKVKTEYIKKRYNKDIKLSDE